MKSKARVNENASDQQLADGLTQNAKQVGTLTVGGTPMQPADIVKVLKDRIAARNAATQARTNLAAAVAVGKGQVGGSRALVRAVKETLRNMFSNDANLLGTFGLAITAHKPSLATKVAGAAKAHATKVANGTTGRKHKPAIIAPAAAQAAPAAAVPGPAPAVKPQA